MTCKFFETTQICACVLHYGCEVSMKEMSKFCQILQWICDPSIWLGVIILYAPSMILSLVSSENTPIRFLFWTPGSYSSACWTPRHLSP